MVCHHNASFADSIYNNVPVHTDCDSHTMVQEQCVIGCVRLESHQRPSDYEPVALLLSYPAILFMWCLGRELNSHSRNYEFPALPLSYQGIMVRVAGVEPARLLKRRVLSPLCTTNFTILAYILNTPKQGRSSNFSSCTSLSWFPRYLSAPMNQVIKCIQNGDSFESPSHYNTL